MAKVDLSGLPRPSVRLTGTDGNAYAVLGAVTRALRKAGWTREQIDAFRDRACSGDYDHLLAVCCEHADVE